MFDWHYMRKLYPDDGSFVVGMARLHLATYGARKFGSFYNFIKITESWGTQKKGKPQKPQE
jgi:hypothetical protein